MAYHLQLQDDAKIHPVFHVSQLKCAQGSYPSLPPLPPQLDDILELHLEPKTVLGIWPGFSSGTTTLEVLIKWQGLQDHEASWEPLALIQEQFPAFHLGDKVPPQPRGIVRPPIHFTYARRKGHKTPKTDVAST